MMRERKTVIAANFTVNSKSGIIMLVGIAENVMTPPLGLPMHGWASRAAGHNLATYVHDDLYVKSET